MSRFTPVKLLPLILSTLLLTSCSGPDSSGGVEFSKTDNAFPYGDCRGPGYQTHNDLLTGCGWVTAHEKSYYIMPDADLTDADLTDADLFDGWGADIWWAAITGCMEERWRKESTLNRPQVIRKTAVECIKMISPGTCLEGGLLGCSLLRRAPARRSGTNAGEHL